MYDVIVVGAGIAGAACARELARYQLSILVLEAGSDVASGATRANSGIVHGGYDPIPGTLKSIYNISGSRMYPALARDLGFSYVNNGSLVVAFSEEERPMLNNLMGRGWGNGVSGMQILESEELHAKEPNLSPGGRCGALGSQRRHNQPLWRVPRPGGERRGKRRHLPHGHEGGLREPRR